MRSPNATGESLCTPVPRGELTYPIFVSDVSLDPSQKEQLVELIEGMLKDNSTLVLGSVISSMCQVCPERLDLIHIHYRKLCKLLIDADEWGQVEILGLLLRYARQQFLDPNAGRVCISVVAILCCLHLICKMQIPLTKASTPRKGSGAFYSDDENSGERNREANRSKRESNTQRAVLDPDHELLLQCCKPLLFSRNPAVSVCNCFASERDPQAYLGRHQRRKDLLLPCSHRGVPATCQSSVAHPP